MITFSNYYWHSFAKKYAPLLDWDELSRNPNISFDIFLENAYSYAWNLKRLATNVNVTMDHIVRHPFPNWSIADTIHNPNTSLDFILKTPELKWDIHEYLVNPGACVEDIFEKAPYIINPLNVFFLHENARFRPSTLLLFPDHHWNWKNMSKSSFVDFDFVREHLDLPWNISALSENPNIHMEHILAYPNWNWNMWKFSHNVNVDMHTILKYPNVEWKISGLLRNTNLNFDQIMDLCGTIPSLHAWSTNYDILVYSFTSLVEHDNLRFEEVTSQHVELEPTLFAKRKFVVERNMFEKTIIKYKSFVDSIEEELVSNVYHPRRLTKLIEEYGYSNAVDIWND